MSAIRTHIELIPFEAEPLSLVTVGQTFHVELWKPRLKVSQLVADFVTIQEIVVRHGSKEHRPMKVPGMPGELYSSMTAGFELCQSLRFWDVIEVTLRNLKAGELRGYLTVTGTMLP
jgi:hypothetical protein